MGCILCNITNCEFFGTEEEPVPNPFWCKDEAEKEEFFEELACDIATRHPELTKRILEIADA